MERTNLQNQLLGALIGLIRATDGNQVHTDDTPRIVLEGICSVWEGTEEEQAEWVKKAHEEKHTLVPDCSVCKAPCGRTNDYDPRQLRELPADEAEKKEAILEQIRLLGKTALQHYEHGQTDEMLLLFLYKALFAVGESWGSEELSMILQEGKSYLN